MRTRTLMTLGAWCALASLAAQAADMTPPPPPPPPRPAAAAAPSPYGTLAPAHPLAPAQTLIRGGRWGAALEELRRIDASGDADWNNLMGYVLRKQATPDLDGAQRHYDAALRIDPRHLGALEYAGELALMKKDLATAEAHLARLQGLCTSGCEPLTMLREAVARYKATGRV
jgi:tetratricopeptide (TPR) repeat protein